MAKKKKVARKKQQSVKQNRPATTTKRMSARRRSEDKMQEDLCCCPPRAMLWIDSQTSCCYIENRIDMRRRLQARADAAATIQIPGGAAQDSQGAGGTQLDEGTFKDQGKVYRTDAYTIHWSADGQCLPLQVELSVAGAINYMASCLPPHGEVTLSKTYMLEPPDYDPPGNEFVTAELTVRDCTRAEAHCENTTPRP